MNCGQNVSEKQPNLFKKCMEKPVYTWQKEEIYARFWLMTFVDFMGHYYDK